MRIYQQITLALFSIVTRAGFQYLLAWLLISYLGGEALAEFRVWFAASAILWISAGLGVDAASYRFFSDQNIRPSVWSLALVLTAVKLVAIALFAPLIFVVFGVEEWPSALLFAGLTSVRMFFTEAVFPATKKNELALCSLALSFSAAGAAAVVGVYFGAELDWVIFVVVAGEFMAVFISLLLWFRADTMRKAADAENSGAAAVRIAFESGYAIFAIKSWSISFFSLATYRYYELLIVNASSAVVSPDYALAQLISAGILIFSPALVAKGMLQPYVTNANIMKAMSWIGGLSIIYVASSYVIVEWALLIGILEFSHPGSRYVLLAMLCAVLLQSVAATLSLYLLHYRVVSIALIGNILFVTGFLFGPHIMESFGLLLFASIPAVICLLICVAYAFYVRWHYVHKGSVAKHGSV